MPRFTSLDHIRSMTMHAPAMHGHDPGYEANVRMWLSSNGLELAPGCGDEPCTILLFAMDQGLGMRVFAIPDAAITPAVRADLQRANGACFEFWFDADLLPDQFAGALWLLARASPEAQAISDNLDEIRQNIGEEAPDIDWDGVSNSIGAWLPYAIDSGSILPGPPRHCYWARLAM